MRKPKTRTYIKTTGFTFGPAWDQYIESYKASDGTNYLLLKPEVLKSLQDIKEAEGFLNYHKNTPKHNHRVLARAFAVVALSFTDEALQERRYANFIRAAWIQILRADPDYREVEYLKVNGQYDWRMPSMAAWEKYEPTESSTSYHHLARAFWHQFDWENNPQARKQLRSVDKIAWKMKYFHGYTFADLSKKYGTGSKSLSQFKMRFVKYKNALKDMLASGAFDVDFEYCLTNEEHLVQLKESTYFEYNWGDKATHKKWYCCYSCLDWTPEEIAKEWLVDVNTVKDFLTNMEGETLKLLNAKRIPITKAPRELTLNEKFPDTPKMRASRLKASEVNAVVVSLWGREALLG